MAKVKKEVEQASNKKEIQDADAADAEARAEGLVDGAEAGAEAPEEAERKIPETVEVKTREGYKIVGRKPTFVDRRFIFMQPEGMKLPGNEVMAAACIESIAKLKKDAKGKAMLDAEGQEIYEEVKLNDQLHPWFYLSEMGLEGPLVYIALWTDTYMPNNEEMAQGIMYAMAEISPGKRVKAWSFLMEMDLYVQLKAFDLVRDYTEYKTLDPDEALAMLQAQERLIEKVKKERADQEAREKKKDLSQNPNFQAIERMAQEYSQRLR